MELKKKTNLIWSVYIKQIFIHVNFIDIFSLISYTYWIWNISLECYKGKWKLSLHHKKALIVPRMKSIRWWHHVTGHGTQERQAATAASAIGLRLVESRAMHFVQKKIIWEKLNCKHHWSLLSHKTMGNFYQLWIPAENSPPFKSSTRIA